MENRGPVLLVQMLTSPQGYLRMRMAAGMVEMIASMNICSKCSYTILGDFANTETGLYLELSHIPLETYLLTPHRRWILAANSTIEHLSSHPSSRANLTFIAAYNGQSLEYEFSHLGCFAGGNFILGGLVLDNTDYTDFGLAITAGCHDTYISTATRIGPESFSWLPAGSNDTSAVPADQLLFYQQNGFWITNSDYILRPEVMESYYYAYRATGDSKYQDWAWDAFRAITSTTQIGSGYSEIEDVNVVGGGVRKGQSM